MMRNPSKSLPRSARLFAAQRKARLCALSLLALSASQQLMAHAVLDPGVGTAGSYFKAVVRVGHGCDGSSTKQILVQIPKGFQGAKPQPKQGWKVTIQKAKLDEPYSSHGRLITEDVVELAWEALGPEFYLLDSHFDEFAFTLRLPGQPGFHWVNVIQRCEVGETQWTQRPESGTSTKGLKTPAARLEIRAPAASSHTH